MLVQVPEDYDATYLHYASSGKRVLALACKRLRPKGVPATALLGAAASGVAAEVTRDAAERDLTFWGFLVLHCPPRPESREVLEALSTSGHTLQMLTGDSLLTATHTATALGLATKPALLLEVGDVGGGTNGAAFGSPRPTAKSAKSGEERARPSRSTSSCGWRKRPLRWAPQGLLHLCCSGRRGARTTPHRRRRL